MNQQAMVIAVTDHSVWVDIARQSPCQTCQAKAGCGKRMLDGVNAKAHVIKVPAPSFPVVVGDQIELVLDDSEIVTASLLLYGLPLLLMLAGGAGFYAGFGSDLAAILGAILGFLCGAFAMRVLDKHYGKRLTGQVILKKPCETVETFSLDTI